MPCAATEHGFGRCKAKEKLTTCEANVLWQVVYNVMLASVVKVVKLWLGQKPLFVDVVAGDDGHAWHQRNSQSLYCGFAAASAFSTLQQWWLLMYAKGNRIFVFK